MSNFVPLHFARIACFAITCILCSLAPLSHGQEALDDLEEKGDGKDHIRKAIRKKLKRLTETEKTQFLEGKSLKKKASETQISKTSEVESEVHAAINPDNPNNIIASPIRFHRGGLITPLYYTQNQGKSWNESNFKPIPEATNANIGGGDPVLAFDDNGRAYFTWLSLNEQDGTQKIGLYWAYSDDGGASWHMPDNHTIAEGDLQGFEVFYDKQWMAVDQSPGSPYHNDLYTSYTVLGDSHHEIRVKKKPAGEMTFDDTSALITDSTFAMVQFTDLAVDRNGHVHCTFFGSKDKSNYGIYHVVSKDGGLNFSAPQKVTSTRVPAFGEGSVNDEIPGIRDDRLYPCPHLAVDQSGNGQTKNNLYLVWTAYGIEDKRTEGTDIYFSRSTDLGQNWEAPKRINNPQAPEIHQFYPTISVNNDGKVVVAWYDRRKNKADNMLTDYYMAYSEDGGTTFKDHHAVTSVPTDFSTVGNRNGNFGIGEYTKVVTSEDYAIPFWADGRDSTGRLNIMTARVPFDNFSSSGSKYSSINKNFEVQGPFPNPAQEEAELKITTETPANLDIVIISPTGQTVKKMANGAKVDQKQHFNLNLQDLEAGTYYCVIRSNQGKVTKPVEVLH